jgi:cytochrome c peroxidase
MRKTSFILLLCICTLVLGAYSGCTRKEPPPTPTAVDEGKLQLFGPLPEVMTSEKNPETDAKVALGRMLYYERRLSKSQQISCNTCHKLNQYGVDGEPTSGGHKGQKGDRNSPTVYNAAGQFAQFWDGRAADVEEQAKGPVMNPVEMAMPSEKVVAAMLKSMPEYVDAFKQAFPEDKDPVTVDNMAMAIGAFERKLVTPSRWDKFLRGDKSALTDEEKAGFNTFVRSGCQTCHSGVLVGGSLFQKLGAAKPWPDTSDPGREKVTKNEADRMVFKVPSMRNIEKTAPYYHDGRVRTLEQAISLMALHQVDEKLTDAQVQSIAAWLKTLTGDIPADYIKEPALPKSTAKIPKPDLSD